MTRADVVKLITLATAYWPNFHAGEDPDVLRIRVEAWYSVLSDLDFEAAAAQMQSIATDGEAFAPPPGVLRRRLIDSMNPEVPGVDQAWAEVMDKVRMFGRDASPGFSTKAIRDAVKAIGWRSICLSENLDVVRGQFRAFYADAVERHRPDSTPPEARRILSGLRSPSLGSGGSALFALTPISPAVD